MKKKLINNAVAFTVASTMIVGNINVSAPIVLQAAELEGTEKESKEEAKKKYRNVMYYGDWSIWGGQGNFYPAQIPADQLTHLNYSFMDFDSNGNLVFTDEGAAYGSNLNSSDLSWDTPSSGILNNLLEIRALNPNLKIGISLGGWSKSGDFSAIAKDPVKRANFINNTLKFVEYANLDFVDIDWEYPASVRTADLVDNKNDEGTPNSIASDRENYVTLLKEFRVALDEQGERLGKDYELSVALPASQATLESGIEIKEIFDIVDFANIMTYDLRGAWDDTTGHQTALYGNPEDPYYSQGLSIDQTVDYLIENGAPSDKIVIGSAFYSRGWDTAPVGDDTSLPGLFEPASVTNKDADQTPSRGAKNELPLTSGDGGRAGGVWSYRSIDKLKASDPTLVEYWDDVAKAPYLYSSKTGDFYTFDNVESIGYKTDYVKDRNLGGMISWMQSQDKATETGKRDELTRAIKQGLYGDEALDENEIVYSELDVSAKVEATSEGYKVSITNNEQLSESNKVLSLSEKAAETLKYPTVYFTTKDGSTYTQGDWDAGSVLTQENGSTVVHLSNAGGKENILPGETRTFLIKAKNANVDNVESIVIGQTIGKVGPVFAKQTIYGSSDVTNQAPKLSGISNKTIEVGSDFDVLTGVSATDKEDGDLTSNIVVKGNVDTTRTGTYTIIYSVTDSEGLVTTQSRTITVQEKVVAPNTAPVISGVTNTSIKVGDTFNPLTGVTVADKEDGDLTSKIVVDGSVDTTKAGTYTLTYSVSDKEGLTTTKTRTVTVQSVAVTGDVSAKVDYEITSDWGTGYNFDITITNTGSAPIKNWNVQFKSDDKITSLWNVGTYAISGDGKHSSVNHPSWSTTLAPGESFKIGGGATRVVPNGNIYDILVNGVSIDGETVDPIDPVDPEEPVDPIDPEEPTENPVSEDISTRFEIVSDWGTGYSFDIYVTNESDNTIDSWAIDFDFDDKVENIWEAGSYTSSGKHTTAFAPSWAGSVKPNETIKIGGMARRVNDGNEPYNITLTGNASSNNNNGGTDNGNGGNTDDGNNNGDGTVTDGTYPDYSNVNVGVGKDWGDTFYSPFVDSTLWYNKGGYSGLYPIADEATYSNADLVNLGFIVANSKNQPSWGGYYDVDGSDPIIQKSYAQIKELRENGGDVLVSFGGENGVPLHQAITDTDELAEQYINFVTAFGLKNIDFDIEGAAVRDKEAWQRNNDAIKIMQDTLGEDAPAVWFTFPTLPTGLVGEGTGNDAYNILQDAVDKGIDVRGVNIMTMCFGANAVQDPSDMSVPVIQSAEALKGQIQEIYANAGINLTDEEAYNKVGITPMIGVSYQAQEVFELEDAQTVLDYANEKGIGMLSFWSLTRDKTGPNGDLANGTQIAQDEYAFSNIFANYNN